MITRTVSVPGARLPQWIDGFVRRHGDCESVLDHDHVMVTAEDGAVAVITPPSPLPTAESTADRPGPTPDDPLQAVLDHVAAERRIGALLVRRSGYAVGIFQGLTLITSKVGSRYVQGKTKAGGWSQQRFARRRGNQAQALYDRVADHAHRLLIPEVSSLDAVAVGGDRAGVDAVLDDHRLAPLRSLIMARLHPVPDPKLTVLQDFPRLFTAVEIGLNDLA